MLLKDELNEYVYAAELAGLGYNLSNTKSGISLSVKVCHECSGQLEWNFTLCNTNDYLHQGYNDKQHVLLDKLMTKLTTFAVDENRFHILKEAYMRGLKNFKAEQPHQHAVYYNSVLLSGGSIWHSRPTVNVCQHQLCLQKRFGIRRSCCLNWNGWRLRKWDCLYHASWLTYMWSVLCTAMSLVR